VAKTENDSYEDLRGDGLIVIYRRDENSNYYVRLKVTDDLGHFKFKVRSLKTMDRKEAIKAAYQVHEDITFHLKSGGSLEGKSIFCKLTR